MAKILFEVVIDAAGGVAALNGVKEAISGVGGTVTKTTDLLSKQEREYQRLMDKIEPARAAAERLANQQAILRREFEAGNLAPDRYSNALTTLQTNFDRTGKSGGGMFGALKQGAAELATSLAGLFALSRMVSWLADGTKEAMEQERALSQLSNIVKQFGGDGAAAAAGAEKLAAGLQRMGIDDSETLKAIRALTVQTHDYEIALSASALAADMSARTGKTYGEALSTVQDLIAGKTRAVITANRDYGVSAKTAQEALDALEKQNRGYGASLDDNLQKTQSAMAQLNDFGKVIGGPISDGLAYLIVGVKGVGAAVSALGLALYQAVTGLVALGQAAYAMFKNFDLAHPIESIKTGWGEASTVWKTWIDTSQAQWQGWGESVAQQFSGVEVSTETYKRIVSNANDAAAAAAKALKERIKENDKLLADMAKAAADRAGMLGPMNDFQGAAFSTDVSSAMTLGGMGGAAADQFLKDFSSEMNMHSDTYLNPLARDTGTHFGVVMGSMVDDGIQHGVEAGILGGLAGSVKFTDKAAGDLSKQFGKAFSDGFMQVFEGKSFQDAWGAVSNGLAGIFSRSLGDMMSALMTGVDSKGNKVTGLTGNNGLLAAGGLWTQGKDGKSGSFNYGAAGGMLGGLVSTIAQQRGDQTMGAVGGALSGGASGFMAGAAYGAANGVAGAGLYGAIIGAIIGGVMGYFGTPTGAKSFGYNLYAGTGGSSTKISGVGPSADTQAQMNLQLADTVQTTSASMRDLLYTMKQPMVSPMLGFPFAGKTADSDAMFKNIISNLLPKDIFKAYTPYLQTGMQGLGISDSRIAQEIAAVNSGDFTKAFAALQAYIGAVVRLSDLQTNLGKSFQVLSDELMRTDNANWLAGVKDTLDNIALLSGDIGSLTSQEQVARAGQIADLAEQQYQNNLAYLQQILQAQKSVDDSFNSMFLSWDEQKAQAGGADKAGMWYVSQLGQAQERLRGVTSPEQVTAIVAQMQQWLNALHAMNWQGDIAGGGNQAWAEQFARDTQKIADTMYQGFADAVVAQNKVLSDAIAAIQDALVAETASNAALTTALDDASGSVGTFGGRLTQASDAATGLVGALNAAAGAAAGFSARWQ